MISGACPVRWPPLPSNHELEDDGESGQADLDVARIYVHGEQAFGVAQAARYQDGLFDTFDLLSDNPRLARERAEFTPPLRIHPYGSHIILYALQDDGVLIIRVLHGRQDWERWL